MIMKQRAIVCTHEFQNSLCRFVYWSQ